MFLQFPLTFTGHITYLKERKSLCFQNSGTADDLEIEFWPKIFCGQVPEQFEEISLRWYIKDVLSHLIVAPLSDHPNSACSSSLIIK